MTGLSFIAKARAGWSFLLTKLNAIGSVLLAYALLNPTAANDLLNQLPPKLKIPAALAAPALWFVLVQYAKARAIKTAPPVGPVAAKAAQAVADSAQSTADVIKDTAP